MADAEDTSAHDTMQAALIRDLKEGIAVLLIFCVLHR
jgi:hypothetical protein